MENKLKRHPWALFLEWFIQQYGKIDDVFTPSQKIKRRRYDVQFQSAVDNDDYSVIVSVYGAEQRKFEINFWREGMTDHGCKTMGKDRKAQLKQMMGYITNLEEMTQLTEGITITEAVFYFCNEFPLIFR